jgi:hypothetical protein
MGRADLIGNGKHHLIPTYQPLTGRPLLPECAQEINDHPSSSWASATG